MPDVVHRPDVPLVGADGYAGAVEPAAPARRRRPACTWPASSTCCGRYGSLIDELLDADRGRPDRWPSRCPAPTTTCAAEVVVRGLRTRAPGTSTTCSPGAPASRSRPGTAACAAAPVVADLMARRARLGRAEQRAHEVEHYLARVEAERDSQQQPDDDTADAARLAAREIVVTG